jgi:hypothetical protein
MVGFTWAESEFELKVCQNFDLMIYVFEKNIMWDAQYTNILLL